MEAETVLDSVVFQLTPTRTRYDLVIIANGKSEKIASGLLDPFLAHLKTAKDQTAKGGYSIVLEPELGTDTTWFTKDTVERFVRYVSTPEVLERVNTLESEILQINEAIAIQENGRHSLSMGEDHQSRWTGSMKVGRYSLSRGTEKAVVLSKNGKHRRLSTGSITQEENSRRQLLEVLDSRKTVLRTEKGMAFARAMAAGFDADHIMNLILFAKSFGASRLLEACLNFLDLRKVKHKGEQWLEVIGAEAVPYQSEFGSMKETQFSEVWPVSSDNLATESNEIDNYTSASNAGDQRLGLVPQYDHGHIQNIRIPKWASHGPPVFQSYPVQSMPYYQSYPANGSAFQSPDAQIDDPGLRIKTGFMESKTRVDQNDKESQKSCKKLHNSRKTLYGITSEESKSSSESQSASDTGYEEEIQDLRSNTPSRKHRISSKSIKTSNIAEKDPVVDEGGDAGNWQTFQKLLLRVQRESPRADRDMLSNEEAQPRRRWNKNQADPSIPPTQNSSDLQELRTGGYDNESRSGYCMANNDDLMISGQLKQVSNNNPISQNEYENSSHLHKSLLYSASDESFIIPFRSGLHDEPTKDKSSVIDMNSDIHSAQKNKDNSSREKNCQSYEPHDLSRRFEQGSRGFDPAKDFDMQVFSRNFVKKESISQKDVSNRAREELKASVRKKTDVVTIRGKSSKLNPLDDAKARAEKLRAFKADLQKAKKEKEEEERKRLEALKRERQKRIAARSSSNVAKSTLIAPLPKVKKTTSQSPSTPNISKFGNSTPKSSSPLRKMPRSSKSPLSPLQTRASLTAKPSPLSYKSSKFSDEQPTTLSPLVKLLRSNKIIAQSTSKSQETTVQREIRLSPIPPSSSCSKGSKLSDFHEVTKVNRSNGLRQSESPVSRLRNGIQSKRVSDPKARNSSPGSSVRRISSNQQQKETMTRVSLVKSKPATLRNRIGASKEPRGEVKKNQSITSISNNEDDLIVEKAIVILENKTSIAPITRASEAKIGVSSYEGGRIEEIELASEQPNSVEVVHPPNDVSQKSSSFPTTKMPDQAPFGRALHTEKSTTRNIEHVDQKVATIGSERNRRTCKSMESISLEQIHEIHKKPLVRGSPKGIKELLKFRRTGQSSASGELNSATSSNVPTLKDIISKGDHSLSTPPKASRTFSLFSPFQNRSTEKKAAARGAHFT